MPSTPFDALLRLITQIRNKRLLVPRLPLIIQQVLLRAAVLIDEEVSLIGGLDHTHTILRLRPLK